MDGAWRVGTHARAAAGEAGASGRGVGGEARSISRRRRGFVCQVVCSFVSLFVSAEFESLSVFSEIV